MSAPTTWQTLRQHRLFPIFRMLLTVKGTYIAATLLFLAGATFPHFSLVSQFLNSWSHWDTPSYLQLAEHGYQPGTPEAKFIAFLPLYPALIRTASVLLPPTLAALVIANVASLAGLLLFYELGRREYGPDVARRALLALLLFPTAYFFFVPYTEGLFLLLTVAAWFFARRGQWLLASGCGGLAALTRITGVLLFPALVLEWLLQRRARQKTDWSGVWLLLIPFCFGLFLVINYVWFGTPWAFLAAASEWHKEFAWPWESLWARWHASSFTTSGLLSGVAELAAGLLLITLTLWSWFKLRLSYAVYVTLTAFVLLSTSYLQSTPRYFLTLFPLFYLIGHYPRVKWLTVPSAGLLVYFTMRWLTGFWAF